MLLYEDRSSNRRVLLFAQPDRASALHCSKAEPTSRTLFGPDGLMFARVCDVDATAVQSSRSTLTHRVHWAAHDRHPNLPSCLGDHPRRRFLVRGGRVDRTKSSPLHHLEMRDPRHRRSGNCRALVALRASPFGRRIWLDQNSPQFAKHLRAAEAHSILGYGGRRVALPEAMRQPRRATI